jgi:hypothetical protein
VSAWPVLSDSPARTVQPVLPASLACLVCQVKLVRSVPQANKVLLDQPAFRDLRVTPDPSVSRDLLASKDQQV